MTGFLAELGSKLADRWAAALVVPGLLYLLAVALAALLGQQNALDLAALRSVVNSVAADPASHSTGTVLLVAAALLAGSVAVALAAATMGAAVRRAWLISGSRRPASAARAWRVKRWNAAHARVQEVRAAVRAADSDTEVRAAISALDDAVARRDAIALVEADRPTWVGDRFRALDLRVHRAYHLDLSAAWPRLWAGAPPELRGDLTAAQDAYTSAARLVGWGLLYLVITPWWWPAAVIGAVVLGAGWINARSATETLAALAETTVDLCAGALATQLGLHYDGPVPTEIGESMTRLLRKDDTPRPY